MTDAESSQQDEQSETLTVQKAALLPYKRPETWVVLAVSAGFGFFGYELGALLAAAAALTAISRHQLSGKEVEI
jgi:hypothetical protein